jgi:hypothetical protein
MTHNCTYIQTSTQQSFNYTTCFDPNGSSSGVFSYTSFTIELQRIIHTCILLYRRLSICTIINLQVTFIAAASGCSFLEQQTRVTQVRSVFSAYSKLNTLYART